MKLKTFSFATTFGIANAITLPLVINTKPDPVIEIPKEEPKYIPVPKWEPPRLRNGQIDTKAAETARYYDCISKHVSGCHKPAHLN